MVIHQREIGYGEDYTVLFEALVKAKAYLEKNTLRFLWNSCTT